MGQNGILIMESKAHIKPMFCLMQDTNIKFEIVTY